MAVWRSVAAEGLHWAVLHIPCAVKNELRWFSLVP